MTRREKTLRQRAEELADNLIRIESDWARAGGLVPELWEARRICIERHLDRALAADRRKRGAR